MLKLLRFQPKEQIQKFLTMYKNMLYIKSNNKIYKIEKEVDSSSLIGELEQRLLEIESEKKAVIIKTKEKASLAKQQVQEQINELKAL